MNTSDSNASTTSASPEITESLEYRPSENEIESNENEFSVDPNILAQEALFDTNVYFHLDSENDGDEEYMNHPRQTQAFTSLREDLINLHAEAQMSSNDGVTEVQERPPTWIPDVEAPKCMSCGVNFTVVKRRHHCRNCGKVFCARCSSNSVPLPKFGHHKPVRVCNKCFIYNLTPFTM